MIMIYFNIFHVNLSTVPRDKKGKSGIEQIQGWVMGAFCLKICNKIAVVFVYDV